jgi:hypothetical protein
MQTLKSATSPSPASSNATDHGGSRRTCSRLTIRRLAAGTSLGSRHHQRYCNKRGEPFNPQSVRAMIERPQRSRRRDLVKSGLAAARARGIRLGRQVGQRPSDKKAKRVLGLHADGLSYRLIARNVGLSKNMVMDIVRRNSGEC